MKKILFLTCLLFALSAMNESHAKKIQLNESVVDTDGCLWKIIGWIDISFGWGPSIEHYDVTISSDCGDSHHFVGEVAPRHPYGGLEIRGNFYDLSYSPQSHPEISDGFSVETIQYGSTALNQHGSIAVQTTSFSSATPIRKNNRAVGSRKISTQGIQAKKQNAHSLEPISPKTSHSKTYIYQKKGKMPKQFPYIIETIKTRLNY